MKEETTDTFFTDSACGRPSRISLPLLPTWPPESTCGPGASPGAHTAFSRWLPAVPKPEATCLGEAGAKSHCLASVPLLPGTPPSQKLSPLSVQWRLDPRRTPSQGDYRNWEGDGDRGDWPRANNEPLDSRAPPASLRRKRTFSGKWGMTSSWKERCNAWVHSQLYPS